MTSSRLDAYCGLYCGSCLNYQCTQEGNLDRAAATYGRNPQDLACDGCRTTRLSAGCRKCRIRACAVARERTSCADCSEAPCDLVIGVQCLLPHLGEIVDNLHAIRREGSATWCTSQAMRWTCPSCGKATWWYERTCAKCGAQVSAGYEEPRRL